MCSTTALAIWAGVALAAAALAARHARGSAQVPRAAARLAATRAEARPSLSSTGIP
jgi:hypothetical protein